MVISREMRDILLEITCKIQETQYFRRKTWKPRTNSIGKDKRIIGVYAKICHESSNRK